MTWRRAAESRNVRHGASLVKGNEAVYSELLCKLWGGLLSRYSDWATGWKVGGSNPGGGEIFRTCPDRPWGPPSLLYNGYRVFPGGKERPRGGGDADTSPLLVPLSRKSRAVPLLPPWAVGPVQSFSACTRVHFTFYCANRKVVMNSTGLFLRQIQWLMSAQNSEVHFLESRLSKLFCLV